MPEDKSKFEAESATHRPVRLQPHPKRGDTRQVLYKPLIKPTQFTFPREVVLRLIDWVKHI